MNYLPLTAKLQEYEAQADQLLRDRAGVHEAPADLSDARLALARRYEFLDWSALTNLVTAVESRAPGVYQFESAAEAMTRRFIEPPCSTTLPRTESKATGSELRRTRLRSPAPCSMLEPIPMLWPICTAASVRRCQCWSRVLRRPKRVFK